MKKKILSFLVAAAMVLSVPATLCAAEVEPADMGANAVTSPGDNVIAPMSVMSGNVGASRKSNTSGSVTAHAAFITKASKASCTITLQEKYNGSWRTATNIPVIAYVKNVTNVYSITASKTFTLKKGKVYRAKVVFRDTNSKGTYTKTIYSGAF